MLTMQGSIRDFFLGRRNGRHKQCTCFLLPFLLVITKNVLKVLFNLGGGGGGGGGGQLGRGRDHSNSLLKSHSSSDGRALPVVISVVG